MPQSSQTSTFNWPFDRTAKFLLFVLGCYICSILGFQIMTMFDTSMLSEEFRTLFTQHRFRDPALFENDYIAQHFQLRPMTLFYSALGKFWIGYVGVDIITYYHAMALVLYILLLIAFIFIGKDFAGTAGALITTVMVIIHPEFLYSITCGKPQAFSYPVLAWFLFFMLRKHMPGMAAITIIAGGLYQPVAVVCGVTFAVYMLLTILPLSQNRHKILPSVLLLSATGMITLALVLPTMQTADLMASSYVQDEPVQGIEFAYFATQNTYALLRPAAQYHHGLSFFMLIPLVLTGIVMCMGYTFLVRKQWFHKPIKVFWFTSYFVWLMISVLMPQFSYRVILYPVMTLLPILLPYGLAKIATGNSGNTSPFLPVKKFIFFIVLILGVTYSFAPARIGYEYNIRDLNITALEAAIDKTPLDSMFAGWPIFSNKLSEHTPLLFKRSALVLDKSYTNISKQYILHMSKRILALINAYLATDAGALRTFHEEWGVDYLIVKKSHFTPKEYSKLGGAVYPYHDFVKRLTKKYTPEDLLLSSPPKDAILYEDEAYYILELAKI